MWAVKVLVGITLGCIYSEGNTVIYIEGPVSIQECETACPSNLFGIPGSSQCFKFINQRMSWEAAVERCASEGLMLARPDDGIALALRKHLADTHGSRYGTWVSARGSGTLMSWTDGTLGGSAGAAVHQNLVVPRDRNDVSTNYCLTVATLEGDVEPYGAWGCSNSEQVLCQVSSSSSLSNVGTDNPLLDIRCPGASKRVGKQCLFFNMEEKLTWYDAKDACAAKGQELAALQDLQGVIDYINNMDNIGRGDYFWTGGSDASTEDTWVWLDGSSVGAIPWYRNNGDSGTGYNCLQVDYEGYYDVSCTDEVYYICADGV